MHTHTHMYTYTVCTFTCVCALARTYMCVYAHVCALVNSLGSEFLLGSFSLSTTLKHTPVSVLSVVRLKTAPSGNFSHT